MVVTRVLYSVIGLNLHEKKAVLGIYLSESEGAKFCGAALLLTTKIYIRQRQIIERFMIASVRGRPLDLSVGNFPRFDGPISMIQTSICL